MNVYDYNYINGSFYCSNVGDKYCTNGPSYESNYSWLVDFESVKVSGACVLAEHYDSDNDGWRLEINANGHPYMRISKNASAGEVTTYTFSGLTVSWNTWTHIRLEQSSYRTIKCTVGSSSASTGSYVFVNSWSRDLQVGSSNTSIRGVVTVRGYSYSSNTPNTATFNLDNMAVGATSVTANGDTFSCPAVQKHLASWTVMYSANGGSGTVASQTKYYGTALTLRSSGYTKDGYTLAGWHDENHNANYSLGGTYTTNDSALMSARWTANTYTVSFNANGGSGTQSSMTKTGGQSLTLPSTTTFTYTGKHITAWRLNSASGTSYALGGSYTTNSAAAFYANWVYNTYSIKFNANGGSGTMANESMTYGTAKALTANTFTREGYRFLGWATSASGSVVYTDGQSVNNLTTTNEGTVNLYAVWQSAGIRVKYNGSWVDGQVYVKHNGEWKVGQVYAKHNGSWKEGT